MDFESLPDGWTEVEYDVGPSRSDQPFTEELHAVWAHETDPVKLIAGETVQNTGMVSYPVVFEQTITIDGLQTDVQTDTLLSDDRREMEQDVVNFIEAVESGNHRLHPVAVHEPSESKFVQFYTINGSELPGSLTGAQLMEAIDTNASDTGDTDDSIHDLPDEIERALADDQMIQVDIYPRLPNEVREVDTNNE